MPASRSPRRGEKAPLDGLYEEDLEEIPYYLRERVAHLVDQKVEKRVAEYMNTFRDEITRELDDQRIQNQMHISHYIYGPHRGQTAAHYPQTYGQYYPPLQAAPKARVNYSKSPTRAQYRPPKDQDLLPADFEDLPLTDRRM